MDFNRTGTLTRAGGSHVYVPSGLTCWPCSPLFALFVGLVVYCRIDLVRAPSVRYLPKPVWALVIVIGSAPFGAIA